MLICGLSSHGRPPLSAEQLYASANFTLSLLPARLAHRLHALRNLPFIVVSNPHIARIYNNYVHSLSTLLPYQEKTITNPEDEKQFTEVMADLVQTHSNTIPILARGFLECRKYISPAEVTTFLDEHLRARIGTRLIAEQHIALHLSSQAHGSPPTSASTAQPLSANTHIGVIDTALRPADIIRHCENTVGEICELKYGVRPRVDILGQPATSLVHVPTHLEYILTELLKNAFRATIESGMEREPVEITIAASTPSQSYSRILHPPPNSPDEFTTSSTSSCSSSSSSPSTSPTTNGGIGTNCVPYLTIRIRDRGGGIAPTTLPQIWGYSFTTFNEFDENDFSPSSPSSSSSSPSQSTFPSSPTPTPTFSNKGTDIALSTLSSASATGRPGGHTNSLAGLGYGLPLGRAYAEHFGGTLSVQTLWGWGTDVYLGLRGLMNSELNGVGSNRGGDSRGSGGGT